MLSPEIYHLVFENANDLILLMDQWGEIIDINNSAVKIFNMPKEEILGKNMYDFIDITYWDILKKRADMIFKSKNFIESYETYLANFNGREYYLEARGAPILQDGKVLGIISILRDVTTKVTVEQNIKRIKDELEDIFNNAPYGITYSDKNMKIIRLNRTAEDISGYLTEELTGKFCYDVFGQYKDSKEKHGRERICDWCTTVDALELNKTIAMEREYQGKWLKNISVPVKNSEGEVIGCMGIINDITKEKELMTRTRESEEKYRNLFENALDAIFILDKEARILEANNIAAERLGYTREEYIGKTLYELIPEKLWSNIRGRIDYILKEDSLFFESVNISKDGSLFPVEVSTQKIIFNGEEAILNISRDISKRKMMENQLIILQRINNAINTGEPLDHILQMAAESVREVFDYAACDIYLMDRERNELISTAMSLDHKIAKSIEELTGLNVLGYRIPLFGNSNFTYVVKNRKVSKTDNMVKVLDDYTDSKILRSLSPQVAKITGFKSVIRAPFVAEGEVVGVIGVARRREITEEDIEQLKYFISQLALVVRKGQLEKILGDSEEKFRTLVSTAPDGIMLSDRKGKILEINNALVELFGYEKKDILEKNFFEFTLKDCRQKIKEIFRKFKEKSSTHEINIIGKHDRLIPVELSVATIRDKSGEISNFITIIRDITERKRAEDAMIQAEKLSSLAMLTAGIAHELNNPLNNIAISAHILLDDINNGTKPDLGDIHTIVNQVGRASATVKDLIEFSRVAIPDYQMVDIEELLEETLKLAKYIIKKSGVKIKKELFPIKIKCSRNQIQQVLFNIIVNACQAMDNGGELHILCRAEEGRLLISFRDTGRGISEENIEEIFNPFFTTKGTGGTGLGLAVAMSIVKRHGGDILVDSEIGKGTTFTVIILNVSL